MRKDPPTHTVRLVPFEFPTEMKDRIDVLDWDKLSMYDQLAFVARETLVELGSENHFNLHPRLVIMTSEFNFVYSSVPLLSAESILRLGFEPFLHGLGITYSI
jgi:hypothetical protein